MRRCVSLLPIWRIVDGKCLLFRECDGVIWSFKNQSHKYNI